MLMPTLRPNPSVVTAALDEETVLLNVETGIYFGLDEIGTTIWSMMSSEQDSAAIVDAIVNEYDAPREQVASDVSSFIAMLESKGLVEPASS